ncbi:MAG: outer membrane lipoprotein carrier protein LolA [Nitrospirae bacterium]|nr:outer membrane lipoprotein carrier protein LolA [Nitrospirota bacterium]
MKVKNIFITFPLLSFFLLVLCASGLTAADDATEIPGMLRRIGENVSAFKSLKTNFVQEKDLAIFQNKIVMKGRIYLQKPGRIAWHVDEPVKYSVVITDKSIRQWDEDTNRVQEIALSGNPVLQNVLNQLTVWFSGDYISLLKDYDVRILKKSPLVFEFAPKANNAAGKIIKSITIGLREDERYLKQIRILEVSGDSTTIIFKDTIFDAPIEGPDFEVKRRV